MLLGILNSQASGGGVASSYELIQTTRLNSNSSSITLSSLDTLTDYQHLQIRGRIQGNATGTSEAYGSWQINGTSLERYHTLQGQGGAPSSGSAANAYFTTNNNNASYTPQNWTNFVLDFLDFSNPNKNSTLRVFSGAKPYFPNSPSIRFFSASNFSTVAATSIGFTANLGSLITDSEFRLYGIKEA